MKHSMRKKISAGLVQALGAEQIAASGNTCALMLNETVYEIGFETVGYFIYGCGCPSEVVWRLASYTGDDWKRRQEIGNQFADENPAPKTVQLFTENRSDADLLVDILCKKIAAIEAA